MTLFLFFTTEDCDKAGNQRHGANNRINCGSRARLANDLCNGRRLIDLGKLPETYHDRSKASR
jgi:hypothetical protein